MTTDAQLRFMKSYTGPINEHYVAKLAELDQPTELAPPPDDPHDEVDEPVRFSTPEESRRRISEAYTRPHGPPRSSYTPQSEEPLTWRTLDSIDDTPPAELLLGMLEPDGPNLLYAPGGTGKGSTGAWGIRELQKLGIRSLIFDSENRPKEWSRRCSGLGVDRSQVAYLQPKDLPKSLLGQPLWEVADHLGKVARASGAGILWIDSILAAAGLREEALKSDAQAPYLYVAALDALGIPSVSFGHPPRATPDGDPYGSVSWVNAMRLTWSGLQARGDAHVVRWTPRKRNERGHISGVLLSFDYDDDGRLSEVRREDDEETTREWLLLSLRNGAKSASQLAEEYADEYDEPASIQSLERIKNRMRAVLRRLRREGTVSMAGTGNRQMYTLNWERP